MIVGNGEMANTNFSIVARVLIRSRQLRFKNKANFPYLSGDGFASLANLKIEKNSDLEIYSKLQKVPRVVYVRSDLVEQLLDIKKISVEEHILLAGNSDFNFKSIAIFTQSIFSRFYLQNSFVSNNINIFTLPIGIENLSKGINGIPSNLNNNTSWEEKNSNVMVGPFSPTHVERLNLLDQICHKNSMVSMYDAFISPKKFAKLMNQHRYVLCPQGNGIDTHRFWEALYRGCVPIILKSEWSLSLDYLNIPMIQLEKWQDFEFEVEKFGESFPGFDPSDLSFLWIDYWQKMLHLPK
jgi:hypothetical protein